MDFQINGGWLINRLQTMGPEEVISRLANVGRHLALRANLKAIGQRCAKPENSDSLYGATKISQQLEKIPREERDIVIAGAEQWLHHRATFFSLDNIPLGDPINWHRDYSSGIVGPVKYSGLINTRDRSRVGDIKYVWELNRLQHLILIALAGTWTENADHWNEIEKQVISWDASNPFMMGVNWKSPLEAGIRLIIWAYLLIIARSAGQQRQRLQAILRKTIYQHQYFIAKFYSKNSSANNHLVGEMAGLYVGSVFWPYYEESAAWRSLARRILISEITRQVEADGVSKERATEYQAFIFEFFLLAGALGHRIGDRFPQEYWDCLTRMSGFFSAISNRTGDVPLFGDGDSGQAVWLPETTPARIQRLVSLCTSQKESVASADVKSVLLLWGQSPQEMPIRPLSPRTEELQEFSNGGYYVLAVNHGRENEMLVVFDAGPLGLPPLNAHGHADALSFWFSYGGEEFLIDPGTFTYHASAQWRSYFRGTAAHNTVRVDGQDQSVAGGTFLWRQAARTRIQNVERRDEFVEAMASHDGYRRLADPLIHTRKLQLLKKSQAVVVADHLGCQAAHDVELFFHFSDKCEVRQVGPACFEALNRNKRIFVRIDSSLNPELYRGCEKPILGWISRTFGAKEPSFTLVARKTILGSTQFVTEISTV